MTSELAGIIGQLEAQLNSLLAARARLDRDINDMRRALRVLRGMGEPPTPGRPRGSGKMQRQILDFAANRLSFTTGEAAEAIRHSHQSTAHCLGTLAARGQLIRIRRGVYAPVKEEDGGTCPG